VEFDPSIRALPEGDRHLTIEGHRKDRQAVVVGVLPDQVDPARSPGDSQSDSVTKPGREGRCEALVQARPPCEARPGGVASTRLQQERFP
jgi:hypothetical protein